MNSLEISGLVERYRAEIQGPGQPTVRFRASATAEDIFSTAYKPLLVTLLEQLPGKLSESEIKSLMRETGRHLARAEPEIGGDLRMKVEAASKTLSSLGAVIDLDNTHLGIQLTSYACPLAKAVNCSPYVCGAVTAFLEEITGCKVYENCKRDQNPLLCQFMVSGNSLGNA